MSSLSLKNRKLGIILFGIALAMVGAAYASVPLYKLFCQITGYAGTPGRADSKPAFFSNIESAPKITVFFNTDTKRDASWRFGPTVKEMVLHIGEEKLAFFEAENLTKKPLRTLATFNVTPLKAAQYVMKTECFCVEEQTLNPHEHVKMPLSFYIDPAIFADPNTKDVKSITLSYTLFGEVLEESKTIQLSQLDGEYK